MIRRRLRKNVKRYEVYYTLSVEQSKYYEKEFGCKCKLLYKCGHFQSEYKEHIIHNPIRMIYAGKFYCNRWKMLEDIVDIIKDINKDSMKITLEIYTKDRPSKRQNRILNDGVNSFIRGSIGQAELADKYHQSDIALHVESLDLKNRLATRFSFSTKIIDCIFSGCAVMAYCWEHHSGLTYLKKRNAAICVTSRDELKSTLHKIVQNPDIVVDASRRAYFCGRHYHDRSTVQKLLLNDFAEGLKVEGFTD